MQTAKPAKATRTAKPAKAAAKPSKPNAADARNAEAERCAANRAIVSKHYAGASPVAHGKRAPKLADALARISQPIQRAKTATERDESALALCLAHSDAAGTFDPVAATADLGALSRLASLGFLAVSGQRAKLTETGVSLARTVAKRTKA